MPQATPEPGTGMRIRWLGRVAYADALALQRRLHAHSRGDHLMLLEHPHVVTLGRRGRREHVLADVETLGASVVESGRGGEVTYHGPGQLVGYPILTVPCKRGGGMADTAAYVESLEQLLIDVLTGLGLDAGRLDAGRRHTTGRPRRRVGVWIDPDSEHPRKIAAIGVRLTRARSMHGFALNVNPDLAWFDRIVPCGAGDSTITSLAAEGVEASMREVVDLVARLAGRRWGGDGPVDRAGVVHHETVSDVTRLSGGPLRKAEGVPHELSVRLPSARTTRPGLHAITPSSSRGLSARLSGRLTQAGVDVSVSVPYRSRKPEWVKVGLDTGPGYRRLRSTLRGLSLVTVCEEADCPNVYECWNDGTATFMLLGERCTRSCAFCSVDTRRPVPPDETEPDRVAEAASRMGLAHVVVTMVARDDLEDGGAAVMADTVTAVRDRLPSARVETLISDLGGDREALRTVFEARPDVLGHNIETVARMQRAVRPSAGYARSLAVLCRAKESGLTTKSSIIVGMGETHREVVQTLADLHDAGTDIVTIGQYLRPSARHLPVARWWEPEAFERWKEIGESLGITHVQASPLTRSSYHARRAADHAEQTTQRSTRQTNDVDFDRMTNADGGRARESNAE